MSKLNCILLIDDDEATNHYHKIIIEDLGIIDHVHVCTDGRDALDYLTNQGDYIHNGAIYPCPELIFLDINMPGTNGFEFLEAYQNLPKEQKGDRVIIMLTTSLNAEDKARAASFSDVSEYRNKPLTAEYILEVAQKYFNN